MGPRAFLLSVNGFLNQKKRLIRMTKNIMMLIKFDLLNVGLIKYL